MCIQKLRFIPRMFYISLRTQSTKHMAAQALTSWPITAPCPLGTYPISIFFGCAYSWDQKLFWAFITTWIFITSFRENCSPVKDRTTESRISINTSNGCLILWTLLTNIKKKDSRSKSCCHLQMLHNVSCLQTPSWTKVSRSNQSN